MTADFRQRILDAAYARWGVDAAYLPEGGQSADVRICFAAESGEDSGSPMGMLSRVVQDAVIVRIRAHDAGLAGLAPAERAVITIAADAPVRAGEVFVITGQPMRMDTARLEWTCQCAEEDPADLPEDGGEGEEGGD